MVPELASSRERGKVVRSRCRGTQHLPVQLVTFISSDTVPRVELAPSTCENTLTAGKTVYWTSSSSTTMNSKYSPVSALAYLLVA